MSRFLETDEDESSEPVEWHQPVRIIAESDSGKAWRCRDAEGHTFWVPKSVLHDDSEVYEKSQVGKLVVKRWFAEKSDEEGWEF